MNNNNEQKNNDIDKDKYKKIMENINILINDTNIKNQKLLDKYLDNKNNNKNIFIKLYKDE